MRQIKLKCGYAKKFTRTKQVVLRQITPECVYATNQTEMYVCKKSNQNVLMQEI